jgi:hypothetical protein
VWCWCCAGGGGGVRHAPTELPAAEIRALLADRAPLMDMQVRGVWYLWVVGGGREGKGAHNSLSCCSSEPAYVLNVLADVTLLLPRGALWC